MDRKAIKENAKGALRMRYWPIVGLELVGGALIGLGNSFSSPNFSNSSRQIQQTMQDAPYARALFGTLTVVGVILALAGIAYTLLFGNVIRVGVSDVRLSAYRGREFKFLDLFKYLKQYKRVVGTMALYTLFVALGFCCFIVPGIIVALGLFEVPYLLADDPTLSGMDVIRRSWEDMKGNKGRLFGFGLSFFGWIVLTVLTCGVLAIFYVGPYMSIAEAGFYHELQKEQLAAGATVV